jgi:hypothetical protein
LAWATCHSRFLFVTRRRINATNRGSNNLTLKLAKSKPWIFDIFGGHGKISIQNIHSRLRVLHGHGDIRVKDFKGLLAMVAGHANIQIKIYLQTEMSQPVPPPARPTTETKSKPSWDWLHWDEADWESWGEILGEKIGWWAVDIGNLFDSGNVNTNNWG